MGKPFADGGYGNAGEMNKRVQTSQPGIDVGQGDVLISATRRAQTPPTRA